MQDHTQPQPLLNHEELYICWSLAVGTPQNDVRTSKASRMEERRQVPGLITGNGWSMKIAYRIVIAHNVDTIHIQLFDNSEIFRQRKGSYHDQGRLHSMHTRKETVSLREKRDIQKLTKKREKSSNARTPGAKHHHHRSWIQRLLVWVPPDYDTTITMGILSRRQCLNFGHWSASGPTTTPPFWAVFSPKDSAVFWE